MLDKPTKLLCNHNNETYDTIDVLKFVGSILVFIMHLQLFADKNTNFVIELAARWCVPFFFITSSFFLFKKSDNGIISAEKLSKYVKRILLLYVSWMIINSPAILTTFYFNVIRGDLSIGGYIKNTLLAGNFLGSWYLLSSIFSACIIYLLCKKFRCWTILFITLPIYVICVLTSVYGNILPELLMFVLEKTLRFPLNIFGGCFYFAIGKCLADNFDRIKGISKTSSCIFVVISYAAYCIEVIIAQNQGYLYLTDYSFSVALLGVSFVLLGIAWQRKISNHLLLRKMSTIIYCAQANVIELRILTESKILHKEYDFLLRILLLFFMAGIVLFVLFMQKKVKWKFLRYLT